MKTFFSRHTERLDVDAATREYLWQQRLIAVHYPEDRTGKIGEEDSTSLDPDDYPSRSKGVIRAFVELAQEGGYVCAQYHGKPDCLMGVVEPNTPIQLLERVWGDEGRYAGRTAILKTLPLSRVKIVNPNSYAMVLIGRPQQGTFMRWHQIKDTIENIVEGRAALLRIESLLPGQQEIMCSEFLRTPEALAADLPCLKHLLMPVGKTMKDIDIIALAEDGKRLLIQVTLKQRQQADEKLQRLAKYAGNPNDYLLLFCDTKKVEDSNKVKIYPIQDVFDLFTSTETGSAWLNRAIQSWKTAEEGEGANKIKPEEYEEAEPLMVQDTAIVDEA